MKKIYSTEPLEMNKQNKTRWKKLGYKCIAEISENKDVITQDIIACINEMDVSYLKKF